MRLRTAVFDKLGDVDDANMSRNLCAKTLMYVLRIALAAGIYYKRTEYGIEKESMMRIGKQTLSRLLRHLDLLHILPPDEVGVIRPSYLITTSVYIPTSSYETTLLTRQMNVIRKLLSRWPQAYVIYLSSWESAVKCRYLSSMSSSNDRIVNSRIALLIIILLSTL